MMKTREPEHPIGTKVCTHLKEIRGHRLEDGEIGVVMEAPRTIDGDYWGTSHVDFPSVPGCEAMSEGLLYRPRRRKG